MTVCPRRGHPGAGTSLVCWRGSVTLSLYCLEGTETKIENLSCQAVPRLGIVWINKWWLIDQIFLGCFFPLSNLSFKVEDSKHEIMWKMVQMMGSLVATVINLLWVNVSSKNSSTTLISLRINCRASLMFMPRTLPQDLISGGMDIGPRNLCF